MATPFSLFGTATPEGFAMRWSYLTDILTAQDGTEQRVQLRTIPVEEWTYLARAITAKATGWLDALIYQPDTQWAVPLWPHGTFLTGAESAGSTVTLNVETTADRDFVAGGQAIVWANEGKAEEVEVTSKTATTLVVPTLVNSYAAPNGNGQNAGFVMPARRARFTGNPETLRLGASAGEVPITFRLELGTDPAVATPSSTQVFNVVPYVRRDVAHGYERLVDRIDNLTYTFGDYRDADQPIGTRSFRVWLSSRTAVASLLAWFHGLKGRYTTFWLPTYQQDFEVVSGLGSTSLTVTRCGYSEYLFPLAGRQHLAAVQANGTVTKLKVTAATDNGVVAGTETLTLDATIPAATAMVSYLLYGRLASDTLEIRWRHKDFAECEMGFVECPAELAPTEEETENPNPPNPVLGPVSAAHSTAVVPNGQEDVPTFFTVTARDANGNRRISGGDTVASSVTGANTATPTITDLNNGQYRGRYTPANQGTDLVAITLGGVAIRNSPYTSIVSSTPVTLPSAIPFGFWNQAPARYNLAPDTMVVDGVSTANILTLMSRAQSAGVKVCVIIGRNRVKDATGRFSLSLYNAEVDALAAVSGINTYVTNGTFAMHCVIDEPSAQHWVTQVPGSTLKAMCDKSKAVWPTVDTSIRWRAGELITRANMTATQAANLDYVWGQYLFDRGEVTAYRTLEERGARTLGTRIVMGLNILNGGNGTSGVRGTRSGRWVMSASEITRYGKVLAASSLCDYFLNWKYDSSYDSSHFNTTAVRAAYAELASFCAGEVR